MERWPIVSFFAFSVFLATASVSQTKAPAPSNPPSTSISGSTADQQSAPPIAADAPRMSKETRYQIISDFETQLVYSRTAFPMGSKGLNLRHGELSPSGNDLQQLLALWGPSIKPGDPAHISFVRIKDDHIHFDLNGGPIHRKKWYQHIQVAGANGATVPLSKDESTNNPHGSYLDIYFDKYVPEMTPAQLRALVFPALDFTAHNKEEAYLDTVPPKVKEAILAHQVLVGMNSEMVIHSKGKPPKKVREKDGESDYEEWIYGEAPQDVDFVRIVGDEVVRIETMKIGGQKIVRTEPEVVLPKPDKDEEAKRDQDRPANAPSLRRAGEDVEGAPKANDTIAPMPTPPPDVPQSPNPGPGVIGRK